MIFGIQKILLNIHYKLTLRVLKLGNNNNYNNNNTLFLFEISEYPYYLCENNAEIDLIIPIPFADP